MRILGRSKKPAGEKPYSFRERFLNIRRIVIIYPEKTEWLRIARYALKNLYLLPEQFEYLLLLPETEIQSGLAGERKALTMSYNPDSEEQERLKNQIMAFEPDLLMQLEPEPKQYLDQLVRLLDIKLKMGFGSEKSGLNVVYSQKQRGFYEKNILNLIALLKSEDVL